jgi:hypothetical protein
MRFALPPCVGNHLVVGHRKTLLSVIGKRLLDFGEGEGPATSSSAAGEITVDHLGGLVDFGHRKKV